MGGQLSRYRRTWGKFLCSINHHVAPKDQQFDGVSFSGRCPRCTQFVLQDRRGVWFKFDEECLLNYATIKPDRTTRL